jgi:hypothetical protein
MLAILSAVFGFAAPFLPQLIGLFKGRMEHQQELDRMRLSAEIAEKEHAWRMAEVESRADIEEARMLHQPIPSSGVALLDAAKDWGFTKWAFVPAFYIFALLDAMASAVRPTITFMAFGGYLAFKWAQFNLATTYVGGTDQWEQLAQAIASTWRDEDWAVLTLCLSYWFGHRAAKASFGGSANSHAAGR